MRRLTAVLTLALTLGLFITGCDSGLTGTETQPESTPEAAQQGAVTNSHGSSAEVTATAVYQAVGTEAAELNGFHRGEQVGTLSVTDDGSSLTVEGEASGLDPGALYISLFYDKTSSVQGSPESGNAALNAGACEPNEDADHPLSLTDDEMFIGIWDVNTDGSATLIQLGPEYVPVKKIGTVSIRDIRVNGGFGAEAVAACGMVTHDPAEGPPS